MSVPEQPREVWFESYGPRIGWFGAYMPTTAMGLYVVLGHIGFGCAWILPVALLAQFKVLSDFWASCLVFPVMIATLMSLHRTASRHCTQFRWGGPTGSANSRVE